MATKLQSRTPDDTEAVFYEAFRHCDEAVMASLWADGEVLCIHPGSAAIIGYDAVTRSWASIFDHAGSANIRNTIVKRTDTLDLSVHVVMEEMLDQEEVVAVVLATNVYQKIDASWLMIEHHGSLVRVERREHTLQ